eukprot:gnl/TRDRNA2_/TRDRNA2_85937_c0_seq2.p1 gnl/TRDRNA2_/TRDRNA2_85937_c0~~gnl/TRDRNA2_/TRDRNA2_85937_c0_seq2.p1  ORF type:complete len:319 (+),score=13.81 gnl/TRDRNA2_/TRDRNA2_85937_c0_seq2:37-993(+)
MLHGACCLKALLLLAAVQLNVALLLPHAAADHCRSHDDDKQENVALPRLTRSFDPIADCETSHFIHHIQGPPIRSRFGRCALVGSGQVLKGKGHGHEIDSHDTVIRVNRLPSGPLMQDVGNKTDVYFGGAVAEQDDLYLETGIVVTYLGGSKVLCKYNETKCSFDIVFNDGLLWLRRNLSTHRAPPFEDMYPRWHPHWKPPRSSFSISHQAEDVYEFVNKLYRRKWKGTSRNFPKAKNGTYPSSGLQAFFTFAPICESITLYGMAGQDATIDDHQVLATSHDLDFEHILINQTVSGDFPHAQCLYARAQAGKVSRLVL